jgi:hypothetical protein
MLRPAGIEIALLQRAQGVHHAADRLQSLLQCPVDHGVHRDEKDRYQPEQALCIVPDFFDLERTVRCDHQFTDCPATDKNDAPDLGALAAGDIHQSDEPCRRRRFFLLPVLAIAVAQSTELVIELDFKVADIRQ